MFSRAGTKHSDHPISAASLIVAFDGRRGLQHPCSLRPVIVYDLAITLGNCPAGDNVGEHRYRHVVRGLWRDGEWLETASQAKRFSDGFCRKTSTGSRSQRSRRRSDLLSDVVSEPILDIPRLVEAAGHQRFDRILGGGSPE
jgi:hypothetical protein